MANACITLEEFLALTGTEFRAFGAASTGTVDVVSVGAAAQTITIGEVVLTAVAGVRTPGSDDFSLASGTALGVAQSIVDAISDGANSFVAIVKARLETPGVSVVALESVTTGYDSQVPISTSTPLVYALSGTTLVGGRSVLAQLLEVTCAMLGDCWGSKRSYGHLYLAAHYATVANGGAGGIVSTRSIDKISESYAIGQFFTLDPQYGSTKWGVLYLMLRGTLLRLPVVGRSSYVC